MINGQMFSGLMMAILSSLVLPKTLPLSQTENYAICAVDVAMM